MPRDATTYRFHCEICGDHFESAERAEAHDAAASCERQGVEAEPLPVGTPILVREFVRDESVYPAAIHQVIRLSAISEAKIGSGRSQQGAGHKVNYRFEGVDHGQQRPYAIHPHLPGQLNSAMQPHRDERTLGDSLQRANGYDRDDQPRLAASAALLSRLSGHRVDPLWLVAIFSPSAVTLSNYPILPPLHDLASGFRDGLDALARPLEASDLPDGFFSRPDVSRMSELSLADDESRVRPDLANFYLAAWALAIHRSGGHLATARAFMLAHRDELPRILRDLSAAWWSGEPVEMPGHLLVPAPGAASGQMNAAQKAALEACGDVQMESRRKSQFSPRPDWREGAICVVADYPTRRNQKTARYRPADAIAGLLGHHPQIRRTPVMNHSARPSVPVICVASGKGGVGKSTVAASLAMALTRAGRPSCLLDLDLEGPSLPALLDLPAAQAEGGRVLPHALADGTTVFSPGQLFPDAKALTWETTLIEALVHFLAGALDLSGRSVLVVDLPPGTPTVQLLINRLWQPKGTLLVTTGSRVAHADLRRAFAVAAEPLGVIENLTRAEVEVEGRIVEARLYDGASSDDLTRDLGTPYLGSLPHRPEPSVLADAPEMAVAREAVIAALDAEPAKEPDDWRIPA